MLKTALADDLVYMEDRLLDEYILNDVGKIWIGPKNSSRGREWVFGQFDGCILPAIMFMLEMSEMPYQSRGDPIKLTRMISKMVNNNDDDNGVVVGRWDGDYADGTAPSAWAGSVDILREYWETKTSVCYGQCWVFAGVTATICRALGIPCRVVSNLVSGHDANCTLSIDRYYDENNKELDHDPLNEEGMDSIWNYHVWNDVWMARPDLPPGYGGWQAIDATPQEISSSSGVYECGPASLEAIKTGAVGFNYDVAFMVASVNADLTRWKRDPKARLGYSRISCNKYHIGYMLLTKKPWIFDPNGDQDREEITLQYKAKENSPEERISLYNAVRGSSFAKEFYELPSNTDEDVELELVNLDTIKIGDDFNVTVTAINKCTSVRTLKIHLAVKSTFYNGIVAHEIDKVDGSFKLKPQTNDRLVLRVTKDKYLSKLVEYSNMKVHAIASVEETSQIWADEDDFQVVKPSISIKIQDEVYTKVPTPITLRFTNPLQTALTKCKFNISGSSAIRSQVVLYPDVKPGGVIKADTQLIVSFPGSHKVIAVFDCNELRDITGSALVEVFDEQ
ncbi:protein-glutamine gamma-glutamyltransferase [Holotrichia oblita]|uniref:Protein-glutamine gamma-glutamyltransferase n=1 Tax=Holotrichia oblita TaxID=644536 RepID=A0ACB9TWM8_HOLOL|nr:protein-glutamine gamma-glutamyltransferase [Holotrichia oblita]